MRQAAGEAHITVIVIVLIGLIAVLGMVLIPRISNNTMYISCCNEAGGAWKNGYCIAQEPVSCEARENLFRVYDACVIDNGKHNANEKYRASNCE